MTKEQSRFLEQASPWLRPSESIHSCAFGVTEPSVCLRVVPLGYQLAARLYSVVATDRRLLVWVGNVEGEPQSWELDEIATVSSTVVVSYYFSRKKWKTMTATRVTLVRVGEAARVIDFPWRYDELPLQPHFVSHYLPWLAGAAATGLVTAEGQARAAERRRRAAEAQVARDRIATARIARWSPLVAGAILTLAGGVGMFDAYGAWERSVDADHDLICAEEKLDRLNDDLRWIERGDDPPDDCPEEELAPAHEGCAHDLRITDGRCHSCYVDDEKRGDSAHQIDEETWWNCPDADEMADSIAEHKERLAEARAEASSQELSFIQGASLAPLALVVGLGLMAFWRTRSVRTLSVEPGPRGGAP